MSLTNFSWKKVTILGGVVMVAALGIMDWRNNQAKNTPEALAACRAELSCWAYEHKNPAATRCKEEVTRLAKYEVRWTETVATSAHPIFSRYQWLDKSAGTVAYIGDEVEFQNTFGTFEKHTYRCDYDPATKSVLDVRVEAGRLPA